MANIGLWLLFGAVWGIVLDLLIPNRHSVLGTIFLGMLGSLLGGFWGTFIFNENAKWLIFSAVGIIILISLQRLLLPKS